MKLKLYTVLAFIVSLSFFTDQAKAQSSNPFAPARNFVIFVENKMTVHGKENKMNNANGGDFIMAGPSGYNTGSNGIGDYFEGSDPLPTSTYIGGQLLSSQGGTMKIQGNAYFKIGSMPTGTSCTMNGKTTEIWQNGKKILYSDNNQQCSNISQMSLNFPAAFAQLRATNQCLASQAANVTWNSAGFVDVSGSRYNFLDLTVAQLDSNWKLTTNSDANHFLVINVRGNGTPVHLVNGKFDTKGDPRYDMINITNIPALYFDNMQTNFKFSILAPDTDGYFDDKEQHGQLVFKNYEQTAKIYQKGVLYEGEFQCNLTTTVGDYAWDDVDRDGRQDAGEPPIVGLTVKLFNSAGTEIASTTTNSLGLYQFNISIPSCGQYRVQFSVLSGQQLVFTTKDATGVPDDLDSDVNPNGYTDFFTLCPGDVKLTIDAGICAACGPQPVNIGQFQGKYEAGVSKLNWISFSENNLNAYEVQRSTDGTNFSTIGSVKAAGTTSAANTYNFIDKLPVAGTNYYRLKNIDNNSSFSYSKVIALNIAIKGINIRSVYPNPFVDKVGIDVTTEFNQTVEIRLTDYAGRVINKQVHNAQKGTNTFYINNLRSLNGGLYVVEVRAGAVTVTKKLNKQ